MSRLTRLPAVRNFEFSAWNRIEIRIRPAITGRAPASPPRTRATHARTYSPNVWAMSSGAAAMAAASPVGSVSSSTEETCGSSVAAMAALVAQPGGCTGGHDVDNRRHIELAGRPDDGHASE